MTALVEAGTAWDPSWGTPPRYATRRNPERKTHGGNVAKISAMLGKPLFPWQRYVVDVALEIDPDTGQLVYDQVVVLAPRRSGKTAMVQAIVAHRCGGRRRASAWITAQSAGHAARRYKDSMTDIWDRIGEPVVSRFIGVATMRLVWNATESFFRPFNPDEDAMHGEDPDLVIVDELWAFDLKDRERIQEGYRPAWVVKEGQEWLLSAAGGPRSEWLKDARANGRSLVESGVQSRTAYFEWGIPTEVDGVPVDEIPDSDLIELIRAHHPRTDIRLSHLESEMQKRGRRKILRAYGGIDEETEGGQGVIPEVVLRQAGTSDLIPPGSRVALGVHVDPDRRDASISAAWRDERGRALTALVRKEEGALWLFDALRFLRDNPQFEVGTVAGLGSGPARDVLDQLERSGFDLTRVTNADYPAMCNRFCDEIAAKTVTHGFERDFTRDVSHSAWRRRAGGGRVWESDGDGTITALVSHGLAVWAVDRMPKAERRYGWTAY